MVTSYLSIQESERPLWKYKYITKREDSYQGGCLLTQCNLDLIVLLAQRSKYFQQDIYILRGGMAINFRAKLNQAFYILEKNFGFFHGN